MQVLRPEYLFPECQHLEKGSFHLSIGAVNMAIQDLNLDVRDCLGMFGSRPVFRPTEQYSSEKFFGLFVSVLVAIYAGKAMHCPKCSKMVGSKLVFLMF